MKEKLLSTKVKKDLMVDQMVNRLKEEQKGNFGIDAIIGISVGMIVAAFILVPGFRELADTMINDMKKWWEVSISKTLFPTK